MKTKPFDLSAAQAGAKLVTRDGREARFIAYVPEAKPAYRVVVLLDGEVFSTYEDGMFTGIDEKDLFLAVKTRSINGYEYPEPERVAPEDGTECWLPYPATEDFALRFRYDNREKRHQQFLKRGRVHRNKENAKQHAIAEILAGGGEL